MKGSTQVLGQETRNPMNDMEPDHFGAAWASAPSPCIDICKYKRQGRCVGCTMTKAEKQSYPAAGGAGLKKAFFDQLLERISEQRNAAFWVTAYRRKCEREGVPCPFDGPENK